MKNSEFTVGELVEVEFYDVSKMGLASFWVPETGRGVITSVDLDYVRERDNKPLYLYEVALTTGESVSLKRGSLSAVS